MKKVNFFILTKTIGFYINLLSFILPKKASILAYRLFSEPRKGKLSLNNLPEILKQAEANTLNFENDSFQSYTWKGNTTTILLIHGWESNASRWEYLISFLKKSGSTIVAIDGPAHGLSSGNEFSIPKYASFIDVVAKKIKPDFLIGHSLGGKTCLYYQSVYTNLSIKKIVILGAPSDFEIIINNYIKLLSLNNKIANSLKQYYFEEFNLKINAFSAKLFASKINTNGLIAHDLFDEVVLYEESKKIANSWKNATLVTTKGLGHSMHDEELYYKINDFLFK